MDFTATEKTSIRYQATIDTIKKAEPNRTLTSAEIAQIISQSSDTVRNINDGNSDLDRPLSPSITDFVSITSTSQGPQSTDATIDAADDGLPVGFSGVAARIDTPYPCTMSPNQFGRLHIELDAGSNTDNGLPGRTGHQSRSAVTQ
jgi:hypothetical protein